MKNSNKYVLLFTGLTLGLLIFYFYKINTKEVVKIGFVGALTAKYSVLGNAMMNGVLLAFEEVDYKVGNKKIELIFKDDKKDVEVNKKIVNDYINQGVKIVIGNVTSSMSKVSMSIINKHKNMFMISAASASNEFSKKDDQFFRVHVSNNAQRFESFTKYIKESGFKKIYGIYDPFNITYTKDYLENFEKSFISQGGKKFVKYSKTNENLDKLVEEIKKQNADLVLICANSVDAARVLQYVRLKGVDVPFASSEWARTQSFIENAGKTSEGVIFNIDYDENSKNPDFISFVKRYKEKYDIAPSMFASKAYELSKIIIEMLEKGEETEIKKNLLLQKEFKGLQDTIVFDEYGDVVREFYTLKIINGKYVRIK